MIGPHGRWIRSAALCCLLLSGCLVGCARRPPEERVEQETPALAPAGTDQKSLAAYQPAKPYAASTSSLLSRTAFADDGPPGYRVELRDWKVPPGRQTGNTSLSGAAFFEVRSGEGSLTLGGQKQDLKPGSTFAISQGQQFEIGSSGNLPLDLRLYLVTAR
jgi:mannose-6-phosphate isomerase-like protein (cupin superfamily)